MTLAIPHDWTEENGSISRRVKTKNFKEALALVNAFGAEAEKQMHHPDFTLGWGYVGLTLTTHDEGNSLTKKDIAMANAINSILEQHNAA